MYQFKLVDVLFIVFATVMCKWLPNLTMVEILLVNVVCYFWITNDVVNKILYYSMLIFLPFTYIDGGDWWVLIVLLLLFLGYINIIFSNYKNDMFVINSITKEKLEEEREWLNNFDKKFEGLPYVFS